MAELVARGRLGEGADVTGITGSGGFKTVSLHFHLASVKGLK